MKALYSRLKTNIFYDIKIPKGINLDYSRVKIAAGVGSLQMFKLLFLKKSCKSLKRK